MEAIEIIILAVGIILVAVTYVMSERFETGGKEIEEELSSNTKRIAEELAQEEVNRELAEVIDEKIERAAVELDRLVNEKILAVGNYSDETLDKINKNHNEVMFLYNMLNEKETTLKDTVRDIEALKLSIKKMALVNSMATSMKEKSEEKKADKKQETEAPKEEVKEAAPIKTSEVEMNSIRRKRNVSEKANNKNEEILRLHANGSTNMEIAKKLGIGIGEVRLVIDLFKKEG